MRRLAMGAVLGAFAFASPVDGGSSNAADRRTAGVLPAVALAAAGGGDVAEAAPSPAPTVPPPTTVVVTDTEDARRARLAQVERERAARARPSRSAGDGVWRALGACESNNDPRAVSRSGRHRGAFQFSMATWRSLGHHGDPIDHSYEVQLQAAKRLQARAGWGQWPACARRLGLL